MTLSSDCVLKELKHLGVKFSKSKLKSGCLKQRVLLSNPVRRVFGVSLCEQEWIEVGNECLPKLLAETTSFLRMYVNLVGIFRIAGSISRQKFLKQKLNNGGQLEEADPYDVGGILKHWLRELQDSLIPVMFHDIFYRCLQLEEPHDVNGCLLTCLLLPPDHLLTLRHLMQFLALVAANSEKNQMDAYNLAVVIAPNIFVVQTNKKNLNDHHLHTSVIEILIKNADRIGATSMFPQQSISQNFKGSELDSSTEFLDSSRKGTVQEFLNGIKKLVGQGTSATPSKPLMPDRKCPSSTSFKRKAEVCPPVTPAKKSKEEKRVNISPLSKESRTDNTLKTGFTRHSRRKTFDILRRKNRNKSKNSKTPHPIAASSDSDTAPTITVTDEFNQADLPKKVSSITKFSDVPASKDTFQKSESDSHLAPYSRKIASASSSSLQDNNRVEQSPYRLRSHKTPYISRDKSSVASLAETVPQTSMVYNCTTKTQSRHRQPIIPQIETIVCPIPELARSNQSGRKQGTISRQQAFIIKNATKKTETITHQTRKRENAYATLRRSKQKIQNRQPTPLKKNESMSVPHANKKPSTSQKAKVTFTTLDFQPKNIGVDCPEFKNVDFNLSFNFENLFLSPPKVFKDNPVSTITPDNATATCKQKPSSTTATPDSRTLRSAKISLPTPSQDVRSLSTSKIPGLISFNSSSSIDSISELKRNARARRSDSMISPGIMPISNLDESCFKTPNQTNTSINWMSAAKYLDAEPPRNPDVTNKRESIAMILRNRGHVQDKIGLFDRHSVYITSNCSTPTGKNTRSCNSATGGSRMTRSKVQKRLPPPPKFVLPETPNKPLKEVTNVYKSSIPKHPLTKKPARSTSVHFPRETRKKVSRSHSSPASKSRISRKAVNH